MSPRNKGWSGKPSPLRKWETKTTLSPAVGVGMIGPLSGSLCAMFAGRYPVLRRSSMSFSLMEEASHLPLEPDPAMVGGGGGGEKDESFFGRWSLGDGKAEAGRRRGEERRNMLPS